MNRVILCLLLVFLGSCKKNTETAPIMNDNKSEVKADTMTNLIAPTMPYHKEISAFPDPDERIPPTQDDINQFINTQGRNYILLSRKFEYVDNSYEFLLFAIIAANKFNIPYANVDLACIFTDIFSKPDIGKHAIDLVIHFLNKIELNEYLKSDIEYICEMVSKGEPINPNGLNEKTTPIKKLKLRVIQGDCKSYDILREKLNANNKEESLLYYAYIMADRYNYQPAKKDIPLIIQNAFDRYGLGKIDSDTQYFIDTVTKTKK